MPVKIYQSGDTQLFTLTSPPKKVELQLKQNQNGKMIEYLDRTVLLSAPFPDKITLITDIHPHHMMLPLSGSTHLQIYKNLDAFILEWMEAFKGEDKFQAPIFIPNSKWPEIKFQIPYGGHSKDFVYMTMERRKAKDTSATVGYWSMRLEFNPAKVGSEGQVQLTSLIAEYLLPAIKFEAVIPDLAISRIDVALDCVGVSPIDLLATIKNRGKSHLYRNESDVLETVYIHGKKQTNAKSSKPTKTLGPSRLKIYDKRAEQVQMGFLPPYGELPVTRIEITSTFKKGAARPKLADLPALANLYKKWGARVAYAPPVGNYSKQWKYFCLTAWAVGPKHAISSPRDIGRYKLHQQFAGDLVSADSWKGWPEGLAVTGMDIWIKMATKISP